MNAYQLHHHHVSVYAISCVYALPLSLVLAVCIAACMQIESNNGVRLRQIIIKIVVYEAQEQNKQYSLGIDASFANCICGCEYKRQSNVSRDVANSLQKYTTQYNSAEQ